MSKSLNSILFVIAGLIGSVILVSFILFFPVQTGSFKPRLEKAVSDALGMDVRVGGRLEIVFFPSLQIRLDDVRVRHRGEDIASAEEINIGLALLPLLRKEVSVRRIAIKRPEISLTRGRDGAFNLDRRRRPVGKLAGSLPESLSISDGYVTYRDERSGRLFEADNIRLDVRGIHVPAGRAASVQNMIFTADLLCREIRIDGLVVSELESAARYNAGVFVLQPVRMRLFGGEGFGSVRADLSVPVPHYFVRASLVKFRIGEYLNTLYKKNVADGEMDLSASLSMHGATVQEMKQTAAGEITLRGEGLLYHGKDFDREIARYDSSQNFNLADAGAFFFAGPLGLAVTKGYSFAGILRGSGGSTGIGKFYAAWKVDRGVAQAVDVAMATRLYRIALKGGIDFVTERFEDMTIALVDDKGRAGLRQKIRGTFRKPVVERPVLMSLAGPALNALRRSRDFVTGGTGDVFYAGSVPAPQRQ